MTHIDIHLLDLPNEILFTILKKLDNMNVLYSLIGIGIERLELLAHEKIFTNTLNFLSTDIDDICSIDYSIINRFCIYILPRIQYNIKCLILEAMTMERILLVADYPNLTELKIFKFNQNFASRYFTDESVCQRIFKQQITHLTVINNDEYCVVNTDYTTNVYVRIMTFFEHLKHLSVVRTSIEDCPALLFRGLPSTIFYSSILTKLCIIVYSFEDCLTLLDGRLKQLTTFIVSIDGPDDHSLTVSNSGDLPDLKCFSLTYKYLTYEYDAKIVPLLRRMCNLEELTLYISIENRARFVDGTQLHNEILIHTPRLRKFIFYFRTDSQIDHPVPCLTNDDIQRTFINVGYEQVGCIVDYDSTDHGVCHIFSLPFLFDRLELIGNNFPNIIYSNVTFLWVSDTVPFKQEFFVRIARSFPLLKYLLVSNCEPQLSDSGELEFDNKESYSVLEYSHMTTLDIMYTHTDYVDQLLNDSKTRLPTLTEIKIKYDELQIVTENFTRDATRLNCNKVKRLIFKETIVHSEDFYFYFPLLSL